MDQSTSRMKMGRPRRVLSVNSVIARVASSLEASSTILDEWKRTRSDERRVRVRTEKGRWLTRSPWTCRWG
jgi:hypothetical protein